MNPRADPQPARRDRRLWGADRSPAATGIDPLAALLGEGIQFLVNYMRPISGSLPSVP
jgi:hypothetical protein